MAKAELVHHSKLIYPDGTIREMIIWRLPRQRRERSHGLKYRLYYDTADGKCFVRYDNETGKGDHKHINETEEVYQFETVEKLIEDFQKDMDRFRRAG